MKEIISDKIKVRIIWFIDPALNKNRKQGEISTTNLKPNKYLNEHASV